MCLVFCVALIMNVVCMLVVLGMVVDVKRSSKANSDRDRCVIVRARVNGTFDAEIIENGELLINIHPNVIRIPTLPDSVEKNRLVACEYDVGQQVMCRAGKYGRWFTGFVEKVHVAGHYKIEFSDGTVEDSVSHKRMRPMKKISTEKDPNAGFDITLIEHDYYVGQEVLMRFPYGCKWRLCTITKVRCDGEAYDVLLNGRQEAEKGVSPSCLRNQGSLLYGYGHEYCPSRKALARCTSMYDSPQTSAENVETGSQGGEPQQDRVYVNQQGEYAMQTPTRHNQSQNQTNTPSHTHTPSYSYSYSATTGKKSNRQIEDGSKLAVSRSDRNIAAPKNFISPSKVPVPGIPSSPTKVEKGMIQAPSSTLRVLPNPGSNGVVLSTMRDRFVQEMHRNVSMLNTSATERKFARIIRQERNRIDSVVRIQACVRGCLVRSTMKYVTHHDISSKHLQGNEFDLATSQIDLMDRYMQALSVAIFKNDPTLESNQSPPRPMVASSLAAMKHVADLITSDTPEEFDIQDAIEINLFDNITDPVEKMKLEMLEIHQEQLQKQRDEMKDLFAQEMRGLGTTIIRNLHNEDGQGEGGSEKHSMSISQHPSLTLSATGMQLDGAKQSLVGESASALMTHTLSRVSKTGSKQDVEEEEDSGYIFGIDETLMQDIDWMKDMYLDIWGNAIFNPLEVVSIIARSRTEFTILEASLPDQLQSVVQMADSHDFVQRHHIFFTKTPENKANFTVKVRLENATGKACKLKCPGDKIADLCGNKRTVKITLDSKNQFDIASSALRLDLLTQCLESLWDVHVAWMAQKLLIRVALHRVVQGISALFVSFPGAITGGEEIDTILAETETETELEAGKEKTEPTDHTETEDTEVEEMRRRLEQERGEVESQGEGEEEEKDVPAPYRYATWISHRFILFQELSAVLKSGQEHFSAYQMSHQHIQEELTELMTNWRFFQPSATSAAATSPAYELSEQLYQVAESVFTPYEYFFTAEACAPSSDGTVDPQLIKDNLLARHQHATIHPILKDIFMKFISCFSVEDIFEKFMLSPLLTVSHQKLTKGFGYAETYDWRSLCAHTRTWAFLLQGYPTDVSSPEFQTIYERFLSVVLRADAEVYTPPVNTAVVISGEEQANTSQQQQQQTQELESQVEVEEENFLCGVELVAAIEDFASRALRNNL